MWSCARSSRGDKFLVRGIFGFSPPPHLNNDRSLTTKRQMGQGIPSFVNARQLISCTRLIRLTLQGINAIFYRVFTDLTVSQTNLYSTVHVKTHSWYIPAESRKVTPSYRPRYPFPCQCQTVNLLHHTNPTYLARNECNLLLSIYWFDSVPNKS